MAEAVGPAEHVFCVVAVHSPIRKPVRALSLLQMTKFQVLLPSSDMTDSEVDCHVQYSLRMQRSENWSLNPITCSTTRPLQCQQIDTVLKLTVRNTSVRPILAPKLLSTRLLSARLAFAVLPQCSVCMQESILSTGIDRRG